MTTETGIVQRLEAARRSLDRACAMSLQLADPGNPIQPVWTRIAEAYRYLQEADGLMFRLQMEQHQRAVAAAEKAT